MIIINYYYSTVVDSISQLMRRTRQSKPYNHTTCLALVYHQVPYTFCIAQSWSQCLETFVPYLSANAYIIIGTISSYISTLVYDIDDIFELLQVHRVNLNFLVSSSERFFKYRLLYTRTNDIRTNTKFPYRILFYLILQSTSQINMKYITRYINITIYNIQSFLDYFFLQTLHVLRDRPIC